MMNMTRNYQIIDVALKLLVVKLLLSTSNVCLCILEEELLRIPLGYRPDFRNKMGQRYKSLWSCEFAQLTNKINFFLRPDSILVI